MDYYPMSLYKGASQNWDLVQGDNGFIYVANSSHILEYNGTTWSTITNTKQSANRVIRKSISGKIYVGGLNDIGYLQFLPNGKFEFKTYIHFLKEADRNFGNVVNISPFNDTVYVETNRKVFQIIDDSIRVIAFQGDVRSSYSYQGKYHVLTSTGWYVIQNNEIVPLSDKPFPFIRFLQTTHFEANRGIVGIGEEDGFVLISPEKKQSLFPKLNELIIPHRPYSFKLLADSTYLVATLRKGILHISRDGEVIRWISEQEGLPVDDVKQIMVDRDGNWWLALNSGIAKIRMDYPLTVLSPTFGKNSLSHDEIIRHQGKIIVSSNKGVFQLDTEKGTFPTLSWVPDITNLTLGVTSGSDGFFSGSVAGLHLHSGKKIEKISGTATAIIYLPKDNSDLLLAGEIRSFSIFMKQNGKWIKTETPEKIKEQIRGIAEHPDGSFWLGSKRNGVFKVEIDKATGKSLSVKYYQPDSLFARSDGHVFIDDGRIFISTLKGVYEYNLQADRFYPSKKFPTKLTDGSHGIGWIVKDKESRYWISIYNSDNTENMVTYLTKNGDSFVWTGWTHPNLKEYIFYKMITEADGVLWLVGGGGLFRLEGNAPSVKKSVFVGISEVTVDKKPIDFQKVTQLDFGFSTLRFNFFMTDFTDEKSVLFQSRLVGLSDEWSAFSKESFREFSQLREGKYQLEIQAQSSDGSLVQSQPFEITIAPPFYRTLSAYIVYFFCLLILIWLLVQYRSRKLQEKNQELETLVVDRTKEIQIKNKQLEEQADKLAELDVLKSRFFSNISHEIRTPLTLVIHPLDRWLRQNGNAPDKEEGTVMLRNALRLLSMINDILELSRLESGRLFLQVREVDIPQFLREITGNYESLAQARNIQFILNVHPSVQIGVFDPHKIEVIVHNLLSNAFKFTEPGGRIELLANLQQESLILSIRDSGLGIPEKDISKVFDRFYQVGHGNNAGSGIGLALSRELALLHHGDLSVFSQENAGSTFTLHLPIEASIYSEAEFSTIALPTPDRKVFVDALKSEVIHQQEINVDEPSLKPLILLVEDNQDLVAMIRKELQPYYSVLTAENGSIGLKMAIQSIPDAIISDVMMPEMDGYEFTAKIKSNEMTNHIPVLLLTARTDTSDKVLGLSQGADDYVGKPFQSDELLARVQSLIKNRKLIQEKFGQWAESPEIERTSIPETDPFIEEVVTYIETHIEDPQMGVEHLSEVMGFSRTQLFRKIKSLTGQTPVDMIRTIRLKRAYQRMVSQPSESITQIAYSVGFSNLSYFARCFKDQFGELPSDFQERLRA